VAHRQITDDTGRDWLVWEVKPQSVARRGKVQNAEGSEPRAYVAPHLTEGWLAFETKREKRRLAPAPEGWLDLSDEDLLELLAKAKPVKSTRRLIE
jgi:hypothetical protein